MVIRIRYCFFFLLILLSLKSKSQLIINSEDPLTSGFVNTLIQTLVGDGVYVVPGSVVISGSPKQIGIYSINGPTANIPFSKGLILSTSEVKNIAGPDNPLLVLSDQIPPLTVNDPGDPLLDQFTVNETKDAVTLQFTFRPKSSQVVFRYGIGTEEYPDFVVDDEFNDVFGFFVSGPKPAGGAYNNQNLAILPNTQVAGVYNIFNNPLYAKDTQGNMVHQFNGMSIAFACTLEVVPCSDYTIKLKICDVSDESYDSAVFLEANRFGTVPVSVIAVTETNDGNTLEGCSPVKLIASKNDLKLLNQSLNIPLTISGSATSGQDYSGLPTVLTIPAGKSSDTLSFSVIEDYITEPIENIRIIYPASCGYFDTLNINIKPKPELILTPGPSPTKCAGPGSVQISVVANGGIPPYSYTWSDGSTGSVISVNPSVTTSYSVKVTDKCKDKDSTSITVNIVTDNQTPPVTTNSPICSGSDLTMECPANADKYYWTGPGGWTATGKKVTRTGFTSSLSGNYTLQIETNNCKSSVNTFSVVVFDANFNPPITSNSPLCENDTLLLKSNVGAGVTCVWTGPSGFSSSLPNPTISNANKSNAGEYSFYLIAGACTSATSKTTVVFNSGPVADFDATPKSGCLPLNVKFTNLSNASGQSNLTYQWDFGNGILSTTKDPQIIFGNPGKYDIKLKVTNEFNCSDEEIKQSFVSVSSKPISSFSASPPVMELDNPIVTLRNLSSNSSENCIYLIKLKDGNFDSLNTCSGNYTFRDTGTYEIKQVIYNTDGCLDSSSRIVKVISGFTLYIPSCFTPDPDDLNDFFRAYGEGVDEFYMRIYDRWGHLVYQSYDINNGWDGKTMTGEKIVHGDIFYYKVRITDFFNVSHYYDGWVKALR